MIVPIRYKTVVQSNGEVMLPKNLGLAGQEVEVVLIPIQASTENLIGKGKKFVADWAGFLSEPSDFDGRIQSLKVN